MTAGGLFTIHVLDATRGQRYEGVDRLLLLELAEHRNSETGACYPSIDRLARFLAITPASVRRAMNRLEARTTGVGIKRIATAGRSNRYLFVFHDAAGTVPDLSTTPRPNARGENPQPRASTRDTPRVSARNPARPRATNPLEPLKEPAARSVPLEYSNHPAIVAERARMIIDPDDDADRDDAGNLKAWAL